MSKKNSNLIHSQVVFTDAVYQEPSELFAAHNAETPQQFATEAYTRTPIGVSTIFINLDGLDFYSVELTEAQNTARWADKHIDGVRFTACAQGSDVELNSKPLLFPFSDRDLAQAWEGLRKETEQCLADRLAEDVPDEIPQKSGNKI